jgi:hypothetical protein
MSYELGKQTGSFVNWAQSGTRGQPEPEVGMGVTFLGWTDRHPGTIHAIFSDDKFLYIEVSGDDYQRVDNNGMSECQDYEYTSRPDRGRQTWRRDLNNSNAPFVGVIKNNKTGRGQRKWLKSQGSTRIRIGQREKYHDFSF